MKTIITTTAIMATMMLASCHTSQSSDMDTESVKNEQLVGAYTNYRSLSDEEKTLFTNTYKGEVSLTPLKVATQVVAGTNYSFLCNDGKGNTYYVVIYQPLPGQGNPEVSSVTKK